MRASLSAAVIAALAELLIAGIFGGASLLWLGARTRQLEDGQALDRYFQGAFERELALGARLAQRFSGRSDFLQISDGPGDFE